MKPCKEDRGAEGDGMCKGTVESDRPAGGACRREEATADETGGQVRKAL